MKSLLTLLAIALLSFGVAACGGASKGASATSQVTSSPAPPVTPATTASTTTEAHTPPEDRDKDFEYHKHDTYFDEDDYGGQNYPEVADATVEQEVTSVVKHYFAAAAAANGARGCSLIYSLFAETIPETYGLPPLGSAALRGHTCAVVMSKLFKQHHKQLAAELATLKVASVRLSHNRGLALLQFKGISGHSIDVHRERGKWKINALLDIELP